MKSVRKISKKYYVRQIMACWLAFYMFFGMPMQIARAVPNPAADALPSDVISSSGLAAIDPLDYSTSGRLDITQADNVAIINWNNFDIGGDATVEFFQPGVTAAVLNRVHDGDVTGIMGDMMANGRVFIINPAGIIFGEGSQINVAQLTASSLDILDSDFLNGLPYEFDAGIAVGDITNLGNLTADDGLVALIGRKIVNEGVISAVGGYVVMAAGDRVFLSESEGLVVEVEMETLPENRTIHNNDKQNLSNTDHVILAAGDIWTAAIEGVETLRAEAQGNVTLTGDIHAYAGPGSDAVADVTIINGGTDTLYIENDITAEATGDGEFDAYAAITIEAAGDIEISSDGSHSTTIKAKAKDGLHNYADVIIEAGGNVDILAQKDDVKIIAEADPVDFEPVLNVANIEITGDNVSIVSENNGGLGDDEAIIHAYAHDGTENKANVSITANGEGEGPGNVLIESEEGWESDDAIVKAEAMNGEDNLATVGISAAGDVEIKAYGILDDDDAVVKAEAWNQIVLNPYIPAPEVIEDVPQEVVVDLAVEGLTNTATVDITAGNNVKIYGYGSGDAAVKALAHNDIVVDIDNYDNEVTVNLTVSDLENNASVTIAADGEGVFVEADGTDAKVGISAEAYNTLDVVQNTGGKEWIPDPDAEWWEWWKGEWVYYEDYAATLNLDVSGLANKADIGITAENGNVELGSDEDWSGSEALIFADAWNKFDIDLSGESTGALSFDDAANAANIGITAGYDIEVTAEDGGEAGIAASAWNELVTEDDVVMTADNLLNDAGVIAVAVEGFVLVTAECEGDTSDAYITADARDETPKPDNEPENIANTANVDITAGENVEVKAFDGGEAYITAYAGTGTDNTANVTVDAGGEVLVKADGGYLDILQEAYYDVLVEYTWWGRTKTKWIQQENNVDVPWWADSILDYSYNSEVTSFTPSYASIRAEALEGDKNTAGVDITAGDDVVVLSKDGGQAIVEAMAHDALNSNTANVTIDTVGGDVLVHAIDGEYSTEEGFTSSSASIEAIADGADGDEEGEISGKNTANVTITATATTSEREVVLEEEGVTLTYVDVHGGDVKVIAVEGGEAEIKALAKDAEGFVELDDDENPVSGPSNVANIHIQATGAEGTDFELVTKAEYTADEPPVLVPAVYEAITYFEGGNVEVKALGNGSGPDSEAAIKAVTVEGFSNTSNISIFGEDVKVVGGSDNKERGEAEILALAHKGRLNDAYVGINARGILDVLSYKGEASIGSIAMMGHTNTAYTLICAEDVLVEATKGGEASIGAKANDGKLNTANVDLIFKDDVVVKATKGGEAEIAAEAEDGYENNAHVGIWTDGGILVEAKKGGEASIEATAEDGYDNDAEVTLVAAGDIVVTASSGGEAEIEAEAANGDNENSAYVGLWADGDVVVTARRGGEAEVSAEAKDGIDNTATVAVCAEGDVLVASGFNPYDIEDVEDGIPEGSGGSATIKAIAEADSEWETILVLNEDTQQLDEVRVETSADAQVKIVSHNGGVAVVDITGEGKEQTATILAEASDAYYNTADVGVAAGGDLMDGLLTEGGTLYNAYNSLTGYDLSDELGLGVLVAGIGWDSKATILAYAHDGAENTADTVICTPDVVAVVAYGGTERSGDQPFAQIKSRAGSYWGGDSDATNTAKTQVYGGDVTVYIESGSGSGGRGIWASADGIGNIIDDPHKFNFLMSTYDGDFGPGMLNWSIDNFDVEGGDDSATLIINTYANAVDCPTCDPRPVPPDCPGCDEEQAVFQLAAPLDVVQAPQIAGCPAAMGAVASELAIAEGALQISIGNMLALNPSIQPCNACAGLLNAAAILRDEDGSRMAALIQVFNEQAPANVPFSPAMAASIVTAFAEQVNDGSQSNYAAAMEYIDAFVQYVAILDTGLGSPVGDSTAFVMAKYGAGITESENINIDAFMMMNLGSI